MRATSNMLCARWNTDTGFGVQWQPLTLAFMRDDTSKRAVRMGGHVRKGFEIVPVTVTIEERTS